MYSPHNCEQDCENISNVCDQGYREFTGKPVIHPEVNTSVCTAVLLVNLADPEWITVDCNEPITPRVLCLFEKELNSPKLPKLTEIVICNKMCVLLNNLCFRFEWHYTDSKHHNVAGCT